MCVRSCGKITDGNERRKCQSDCMYGGKHFGYKEEAIGRSYGSGNYEMCMRNCDRREDSNDRQRCRNRCSSMFGRYYGSFNMQFGDFNKEEATAAQRFSREQMDRWMNEYKVADSDSSDDNHHKHHHDDDSDSDSA